MLELGSHAVVFPATEAAKAAALPLCLQVAACLSSGRLRRTTSIYLKYGTVTLAGRYFLLTDHGVPVRRHKDGGIVLGYATTGLRGLLRHMRRHDSQGRLPANDDAALAYIRRWLAAWPEMQSGRRWH